MVGGGLPFAMHFREMAGPGCKVCSVNLKRKKGRASETWKKGGFIILCPNSKVELQTVEKDMSANVEYPFAHPKHCYFQARGIASSIYLELLHHFACTHS